MLRLPFLTGLLLCTFAVGCGTTQSWSSLTSRFSKNRAEQDALVLDETSLSEGFQKARGGLGKKGLKNPEATNLAFARWKEDMDQFAEAKRRYHEILTANPDCLPARLGIARIERETGRFTQCREILEAAQRQHPDNPLVALETGRMYNERKQWDDAVRAFGQAADLAPDDQTIRYELGLALANAGRLNDGLPHLKFAVGESAAFYNVAYLLEEQGNTEAAVAWIERAMSAHPDERTHQMASELLADIQMKNPALRPGSGTRSAIASRHAEEMSAPQIIAASPATSRTAEPQATSMTRTTGTWASRSATPQVPAARPGYAVASSAPPVAGTATVAAPPQWSGPGATQQPQQSQWTRSARTTVPVHAAGYSQTVGAPAQPPVWRQ